MNKKNLIFLDIDGVLATHKQYMMNRKKFQDKNSIAKELNIPITLVAIDFIDTKFNNIQRQNFHIKIGETFKVDNIREAIHKSRKYFQKTLTRFIKQKYVF